jgi:hypothetical protein
MTIKTIGLDLAKNVFQAHGVDERGATVLTKRLHRKQMLPFFSTWPHAWLEWRCVERPTTGLVHSLLWVTCP